ncbi:hypothetical protein MELA_01349 [Candidatus Methylomirabilis lanthanidiphila]|uniref:Uncharacterized protein n=1 Tax=Candidatus Methylomirabilis lanthanidiphila TaxID=2211376 RepID=A0A564ZI50_9BACT|nr:hypothetical protein MELA_01349 [Candidatus Methylomirabilis lanthanidiphila]
MENLLWQIGGLVLVGILTYLIVFRKRGGFT